MSSSIPQKRDNNNNNGHCAPAKRTKTMEDRENTSHLNRAPPTTHLDLDGDLRLRVSAEVEPFPQDFVVCSRTLYRSSREWPKLVGKMLSESKFLICAEEEMILHLPQDASRPLSILLHACHARFEFVPERLEHTDFYDLLILADKYKMRGIIKPWIGKWHAAVRRISPQTSPSLIYIAWALDDTLMLEKQLQYWTVHASTTAQGSIALQGRDCTPEVQATEAFKKISPTRERIIAELIDCWHVAIDKLLQRSNGPCHNACKATHLNNGGTIDCGALMLGHLKMREHSILGGQPLSTDAQAYRGTIDTLKRLFSENDISSFEAAVGARHPELTRWCASFKLVQSMQDEALDGVTKHLSSMVSADMRVTLKQNVEETGSLARQEVHAPAMQ